MKHIISLLSRLFIALVQVVRLSTIEGKPYICRKLNQPFNCTDNPRIRLSKTAEIYQLRLCFDNPCGEEISFTFRCSEICEACRILTPPNNCAQDAMCEDTVDQYLNSFCASTIVTIGPGTHTFESVTNRLSNSINQITPTQTKFSVINTSTVCQHYSQATSVICDRTIVVTTTPKMSVEMQLSPNVELDRILVTGLGALVGLLVMLLTVVTTGWACTCWAKNGGGVNMIAVSRNHTHESATRNSLPAGYDEVHLRSEENGHRDALCHILECGQTHAGGNEQNNDPTHAGTPRNSDCTVAKYDEVNLPSAENVESFYHLLESGHHVNDDSELHSDTYFEGTCRNGGFAATRTSFLSEDDQEDYDLLEPVHTNDNYYESQHHDKDFENSPKITSGSAESLTVTAARYDAVKLILGEDTLDYDVLDRGQAKSASCDALNHIFRDPLDYDRLQANSDDNIKRTTAERVPKECAFAAFRYDTVNQLIHNKDYSVLERGQAHTNEHNIQVIRRDADLHEMYSKLHGKQKTIT